MNRVNRCFGYRVFASKHNRHLLCTINFRDNGRHSFKSAVERLKNINVSHIVHWNLLKINIGPNAVKLKVGGNIPDCTRSESRPRPVGARLVVWNTEYDEA